MATVIKIANALVKHNSDEEVSQYLESLGAEWTQFVEGELKRSNEKNNRVIGSQTKPLPDDDPDDYHMNVNKLMEKFN